MSKEDKYQTKWMFLKHSYAFLLFFFFGLIIFPLGALYLTKSPLVATVIFLITGLAFFKFGIDVFLFECPRCDNRFFIKSGWQNIFTSHCRHCGIKKGTNEAISEDSSNL